MLGAQRRLTDTQSCWQALDKEDPWHVSETEMRLAKGFPLPQPDDRQLLPENALVIDEEAAQPVPSV